MIEKWLYAIRPPKFLRYLFFIAYNFYRKFITHRGDAHFTAIVFLAMIHLIAYEAIFFYTTKLLDKKYVLAIMFFVFIQFYVWFWYKQKWKIFLDEFKHVNRKQQLLGGGLFVHLFIYKFNVHVFANTIR